MFIELSLTEALARIGPHQVLLDERFVPAQVVAPPHCPYLPEYGWLFRVERTIGRVLDPWLLAHRQELIGPGGLLSEALSNAYCHGHRRDARRPIHVTIYQGQAGIAVRIWDTGTGFDVVELKKRVHRGKGYFHIAGTGLARARDSQAFSVFYEDGGRAFHLLRLFETVAESATPTLAGLS